MLFTPRAASYCALNMASFIVLTALLYRIVNEESSFTGIWIEYMSCPPIPCGLTEALRSYELFTIIHGNIGYFYEYFLSSNHDYLWSFVSNLWSFALKKISHADTADLRGNLSHGVFAAHKIHKRHKSAHVTLVLASGVEISSKLHASGELKFSSAQPTPNREQNQAMLELCRDAKEENYKLTDAPLASAAQPPARAERLAIRVHSCDSWFE